MSDKKDFFPRKIIFEEVQDLVASFLTSGDYFSENNNNTSSKLVNVELEEFKEFYIYLFTMSLLYHCDKVKLYLDRIMKTLKSHRKVESIVSDDIMGDLDIDRYITLNKVEYNETVIYPSKIRTSTFQMPEYQLTLKIVQLFTDMLSRCDRIIRNDVNMINRYEKSTIKTLINKNYNYLLSIRSVLTNKYGVKVDRNESHNHLVKKVLYRYKNRKIIIDEYLKLNEVFTDVSKLKGVSNVALNDVESYIYNEKFDDRLFEIWCLNRVSKSIQTYFNIINATYNPLHLCNDEPVIILESATFIYEVWFQNRAKVLNFDDIKWFYTDSKGTKRKLDAIPDIIIVVKNKFNNTVYKKVIVDAKNREWTLESLSILKDEVTHLIFIKDNFITEFNQFSGVLISYNRLSHREMYFNHEDTVNSPNKDEIRIISLDINNLGSNSSFKSVVDYLR